MNLLVYFHSVEDMKISRETTTLDKHTGFQLKCRSELILLLCSPWVDEVMFSLEQVILWLTEM